MSGKVLVGKDSDGLWYAVKGSFGQEDFDNPANWIAGGLGTWERAMWWAWNYIKHGKGAR